MRFHNWTSTQLGMEAFDMKRQCSYVMCVSVEVIAAPTVGALRVFTIVDTWIPK